MLLVNLVALVQLLVNAELLFDISLPTDKFSDGELLIADDTIYTPSLIGGEIEIAHGYDGQEGNWAIFHMDRCMTREFMRFYLDDITTLSLKFDMYYDLENGTENYFWLLMDNTYLTVKDMTLYAEYHLSDPLAEVKERTLHHFELHGDYDTDSLIIEVDGREVLSAKLFTGRHGMGESPSYVFSMINFGWSLTSYSATSCFGHLAVSNFKIYDTLDTGDGMLEASIVIDKVGEVPDVGGRIKYTATIKNTYATSENGYIFWLTITLPSGLQYPVKRRSRGTLAASGVFDASKAVKIPGWVAAGSYQLTLVVVDRQNGDITTATSSFVKL